MISNKNGLHQKHKHSKYITIMLIPEASSSKVKSLKVGRWVWYFSSIICLTIMTTLLFSSFSIITFDAALSNIKTELKTKERINSNLLSEKNTIESSLENEKLHYQSQLKALEEKSRELEDKLEELEKIKEDLYNKISFSGAPLEKHASKSIKTALGGPIVALANTSSTSSRINSKFDSLMYSIEVQKLEFKDLSEQVELYLPYIEAYPSTLPVYGTITSPVGYRSNPFYKSSKNTEYHTGLDIKVNKGTDVIATGAGTVTFSGYQSGYGYIVIINHGYGIETRYGHNSSLLVKVGNKVNRGDVISKSGNTGRSTGPHVHYEIRLDSKVQDPLDYVGEEYINVWKSKQK